MTMLNKAFGPPFRWKNSHALLNYRTELKKNGKKKTEMAGRRLFWHSHRR